MLDLKSRRPTGTSTLPSDKGWYSRQDLVSRIRPDRTKAGDSAQPRQPLPGILNLGETRVGVFPEGEKSLVELRPASETGYPGKVEEWTAAVKIHLPSIIPYWKEIAISEAPELPTGYVDHTPPPAAPGLGALR